MCYSALWVKYANEQDSKINYMFLNQNKMTIFY